MMNENIWKFFQKLEQNVALKKEYEELMSDNISLIVIVVFARQLGFSFTTRELAEYIILTSSTKKAEEPKSNILPFGKEAG